jgi:hypothetical protein
MNVRHRDPTQLALPPVTLDWTLDFASSELKQAMAYWRSCCGQRKRPAREDLNPVGMAAFLKHVVLIDVHHMPGAKRAYRVRLAGTYVEQVYGPISGHQVHEVLPPAISDRWQKCFDAVVAANRPLRLTGRVGFKNKSWLNGEILLAPLGDEGCPVSMIFIAFVWRTAAQSVS